MNAPAALRDVHLDDRYRLLRELVLISGIQALVRVPLLRRELDAEAGLNTAGFISGYRGSPLGGYDQQLWKVRELLDEHHIVFRPGVNEDLAATAVWGTQQVGLHGKARFDGVFGIWYGKSPGVDRSGDALRHANFYGTARYGGVLAIAGDDHACKSSSMPNQSEFAFIDAEMPILHPADVAEVIEFGVKGIALSRYCGAWVALKTTADTMDSSATVIIDPDACRTVLPGGFEMPPGGVHARDGEPAQVLEARHRGVRLPAAQAFAAANGFDRLVYSSPAPRIGIACTGKAFLHVVEALDELGIDARRAAELGIVVFKIGLVWPIEPSAARRFARGLEEIVVIEERRDVVEHQLRALLYDLPDGERPRIVGKRDEHGARLVPDTLDLDTAAVVAVLRRRLPGEALPHSEPLVVTPTDLSTRHERLPMFCSGCPHNRSTRVPEGSRGMAGVGCHFMARWNPARNSAVFTHMGGEGVPWVGEAPFTDERHIYANLGDGTYFHSGILAIRQALAAGVNITFKLLFNDAVAMTGGQPVDGVLTVPMAVEQIRAEGVEHIVVVSDDPGRHAAARLPPGVEVKPRESFDQVQQALRDVPGVSVIVFDQMCATERRRQRKRGRLPRDPRRVIINELVCEDCGDCTHASGCVSLVPRESRYGRVRAVDQSSCNQDFSCVEGFCPSFVTVEGEPARRARSDGWRERAIDDPPLETIGERPFNLLISGVGGQGVTSLGAIIAMAANMEGRSVRTIDQTGLAQKGGSVTSHVRIGRPGAEIAVPRIPRHGADLLIGGDLIVSHAPAVAGLVSEATRAVVNTDVMPSLEFVLDPDTRYDTAGMLRAVSGRVGQLEPLAAHALAREFLGDAVYAQVLLAGYAWQRGWLPLSKEAIEAAIRLNGAQVEANLDAFRLGRLLAHDPAVLEDANDAPSTLAERIRDRAEELRRYQNDAYAERFSTLIASVQAAEERLGGAAAGLTERAVDALFRVMAYKDEYEVARLFSDGRFAAQLEAEFGHVSRRTYHLAPPLLSGVDPATGRPRKLRFGAWMGVAFRLLRHLKFLRGSAFDPFGYTAERRAERAFRDRVEGELAELAAKVTVGQIDELRDWLDAVIEVRGFGPVKAKRLAAVLPRLEELANRIRYPERVESRQVA